VALSGYGQDEDRTRGLAAGFDRYLVKPVSAAALRDLLEGSEPVLSRTAKTG
jgi:CheY-like chemotaxis protein